MYVCICVCMYVFVSVCMYLCMYVCMFVLQQVSVSEDIDSLLIILCQMTGNINKIS